MSKEDIRNKYIELRSSNEEYLSKLKKRQFIISLLRLGVFLGGGVATAFVFTFSLAGGIIALITTIAVFLFLVRKYDDFNSRTAITQNIISINCNEIRAMDGDYSSFEGGADLININHDFSGDIDLFGEDSVFCYLNRTVTGAGRSQLARWLCEPYNLRGSITDRQEAVKDLSSRLGWRQTFLAHGFEKQVSDEEIISLNKWLDSDDSLFSSGPIRTMAYVLPAAAFVALFFVVAGILPFIIFLLSFLLNLFIVGLFLRRINRIHEMVSKKHLFLSIVAQLIRTYGSEKFTSPVLTGIQEKLCTRQGSVADIIKKLGVIISSFDNRLNMIVGLVLNGILMWDFHCIMKLEKWRNKSASGLREWLTLLGTIDGLTSLANYAFNNPDHCYPEIADDGTVIEATCMGHPLLPGDIRVCNDFSILKPGLVYIITGANMAGKSTFLRTVAVNMVLAMTGAPVCCTKMRFSPQRLFTSMRTVDSLSHKESYFYAELKRLKILKERLERKEEILFVLDEILKGTNSTDKSLGSKQFMRLVAGLKGTGLVATHDISLGEMESEFPGVVYNKCFEIDIDGEKISFDYRLREGITRKMNAAVLMRQMGIV